MQKTLTVLGAIALGGFSLVGVLVVVSGVFGAPLITSAGAWVVLMLILIATNR